MGGQFWFIKGCVVLAIVNVLLSLLVAFPPIKINNSTENFTHPPVYKFDLEKSILGTQSTTPINQVISTEVIKEDANNDKPQSPESEKTKSESTETENKQPEQSIVPDTNLLSLIQKWRAENGLAQYRQSNPVCQFAQGRAETVVGNLTGGEDPHRGFKEDLQEFFDKFCQGSCQGAENIAWGYSSPSQALSTWLDSEGHRGNLEANYVYSCLIDYGSTAVQVFMNY